MSLSERIQILQASHVKLMTDLEIFWQKHEVFVAEQDREWERQKERWRQADVRAKDLDERIEKMVGGIGEFIRQQHSKS
jgi:hypothetical protein